MVLQIAARNIGQLTDIEPWSRHSPGSRQALAGDIHAAPERDDHMRLRPWPTELTDAGLCEMSAPVFGQLAGSAGLGGGWSAGRS